MSDSKALAKRYLSIITNQVIAGRTEFEDIQTFSRGESLILRLLAKNGGQSTPGKLRRDLDTSTARIASSLNRLEQKQLITRTSSSSDRRKVIIQMTLLGMSLVEEREERILNNLQQSFFKMGEEKGEIFLSLFEEFITYSQKKEIDHSDKKK